MLKERYKSTKGITLVALVITIIILLILATISIQSLTNTGLFKNAQKAKDETQNAAENQAKTLNEYEDELNKYVSDNKNKTDWTGKVNKPKLMTGMTAIKFNEPAGDEKAKEGSTVKTTDTDAAWYDYDAKKWANAQTQDGSMWVWIPRFAYKVNSSTKTFDVVFLKDTTNTYLDNGTEKDAEKEGYIVHPAFKNESSTGYENGGWDKELTGIWVSKFEAGYATSNGNSAPKKASSVNYSQTSVWASGYETGGQDGSLPARNWIDGVYGNTKTSIKYPTFQGLAYSMNYTNHNDAFNISRALTESGNIYGLSSTATDSHLMKNSEWGAVAYLAQSKYGLNGTNIYINNANLRNSQTSAYAITGCAGETEDAAELGVKIDNSTKKPVSTDNTKKIYTWTQKSGTKASTTGTIYGVYDMSGGTWERTAGLVNNENENLATYGQSLLNALNNGKSSKYVTVYPHNASVDKNGANIDTASTANWKANTKIYGDGIRETSTAGTGKTSWYTDYSYFPAVGSPFSVRGGDFWDGEGAGLFYFNCGDGGSGCNVGFRSVLVAQ